MLSIGQLIVAGLLKFVWILIIQGPLVIISYIAKAIQYLTQGILWNIFFNTNGVYHNGVITPPNFDDIKVPWIFLGFALVALFIGFMVLIWQVIKTLITKSKDGVTLRKGILDSFKFFGLAFLITFMIPALFFILIAIMGYLSEAITLVFNDSTKDGGVAQFLYMLGAPNPLPSAITQIPSNFSPPDDQNILQWNMLVQWLGTWFALFALLIVTWIIMLKTAELFFLFVISPFLAFSMPLDDGKRFVLWKNMVISKVLVILGNLVMYFVYVILISLIHTTVGTSDWFANTTGGNGARVIVELAFIAGASMAVFSASSIIASFVGESFGMREGMDTFRGFVGLMGMGGAMGLMSKGVALPFKLGKKGFNAGKKADNFKKGMQARMQRHQHNKIDKQLSDGKISKQEADIKHEKVGKHLWRKKKLNDLQEQQQTKDKGKKFSNKNYYNNTTNKKEIEVEEHDKNASKDNKSQN